MARHLDACPLRIRPRPGAAFAVVFQACWYIPTTVVGARCSPFALPVRVRVPVPVGPPAEQPLRASQRPAARVAEEEVASRRATILSDTNGVSQEAAGCSASSRVTTESPSFRSCTACARDHCRCGGRGSSRGAVNAYYGPRGFMPLDHSVVFDGGWRILDGQVPFRDYTTPNALIRRFCKRCSFLPSGSPGRRTSCTRRYSTACSRFWSTSSCG